jgi:flagellar motor switch protein FliN
MADVPDLESSRPCSAASPHGRASANSCSSAVPGTRGCLELDRKVGEAIDIYVNNRLVARGEVVLVEDKLGVTMTEIIKAERT